MAHWNGKEIVYHSAIKSEDYPDWDIVDCGCCDGIKWGGNTPIECGRCEGKGHIFYHRKSKVYASYPGGRFC